LVTLYPPVSPGTAPRVLAVKSKYSGFRFFLDGAPSVLPFNVQFTATMDWAGHPPGTVKFIAPRKTYIPTASGSTVSQTLSMKSDFGPGGRLRVVAVSSDGTQSAAKLADLVVMPN